MSLRIYAELEQGTDEWLQARAGIVTASVAGKLITTKTLKVAANDTSRALAETLAAERITGVVEHMPQSRDMLRGTLLEPTARTLYGRHYAPAREIGFMRWDADEFSIGYSPDGLVGDDGLIEIKSRNARIQLAAYRTDSVPLANMAQLQTGLLVSGREWIDYVSYSPGLPLYVKRVHPDTAWFEAICAAVINAETSIRAMITEYQVKTVGLHPTEYWDPFEVEEGIY